VSSVAEQSGIPKRTVEFNVIKLKELEILARKGGAKNGYWEVKV
jgi:hypothetical protein